MSGTIVVVLARAGSVRLPRKNVAPFFGRPLVSWAYERALALAKSGLATHLAVSSDDPDVLALAPKEFRIIERPPELATATATSFDAMAHAVRQIEATEGLSKLVVLLQPTSPLASAAATVEVVQCAARGIAAGLADSYISIASLSEYDADIAAVAPDWRLRAKNNGVRLTSTSMSGREAPVERVADAVATHLITGATYAVERNAFFRSKTFFFPAPRTFGLLVPARESIDIDTQEDFATAIAIGNVVGAAHSNRVLPSASQDSTAEQPASIAADYARNLTEATKHMRRGKLREAAIALADCDPAATEVVQLTSRLKRFCSQALSDATEPDSIVALAPAIAVVSPPDEFAAPIAAGLTTCLKRGLRTSGDTLGVAGADKWLEALNPLLVDRRVPGTLFDAALDLIERDPEASIAPEALLSIAGKWRQSGYLGLSDERLSRLAIMLGALAHASD